MGWYCFIITLFFITSSSLIAGKSNSFKSSSLLSLDPDDLGPGNLEPADFQNDFLSPRGPYSRIEFIRTIAPTLKDEDLCIMATTPSNPLSPAALCYLELSCFLSTHHLPPKLMNTLTEFFEGNRDFEENGNYFDTLQTLRSVSSEKFVTILKLTSPYFPQFGKEGMGKLAFFVAASNLSLNDIGSTRMNVAKTLANYVKDSLPFTPSQFLTKEIELLYTLPEEERTESLLLINTKREAFSKLKRSPSELFKFLSLVPRNERTLNFVEHVISLLSPLFPSKRNKWLLQVIEDIEPEKLSPLLSMAAPLLATIDNPLRKATLLRAITILLVPHFWKEDVLKGLVDLFPKNDIVPTELVNLLATFSQNPQRPYILVASQNLFQGDPKTAKNMINLVDICNTIPLDNYENFLSILGEFRTIQRHRILDVMASFENINPDTPLEMLRVLKKFDPKDRTDKTIKNLYFVLSYSEEKKGFNMPFTSIELLTHLQSYEKDQWPVELKQLVNQTSQSVN